MDKGPLPEEILKTAVITSYKLQLLNEAAALLADWRRVEPRSEAFNAQLAKLRSNPMVRGSIPDEKLAAIEALFGEKHLVSLKGPRSLARAKRISRSFLTHYHHAVPFDRNILRAAWGDCSVEGCRKAQDQIEEHLGEIATPRRSEVLRERSDAGSPVPSEATDSMDRSGLTGSG